MNGDPGNDHWLTLAHQQMTRGDTRGAIESLRRALGSDPSSADAHGLLSLCLVDTRRLAAAEHEAKEALALEPESTIGRLALAAVHLGRNRPGQAEALYRELLAEGERPIALRGLARALDQRGKRSEARRALDEALALEPEDVDALVLRGVFDLRDRRFREAEASTDEALILEPEHAGALILKGHLLLRRGEAEAAREHALWALRADATSKDALTLLGAVKARQSWWLGLWWRLNGFVSGRPARVMGVLLGSWLVVRVAEQLAQVLRAGAVADTISTVWLAFCVYTWVAPAVFRRMLERELAPVRLSPRF